MYDDRPGIKARLDDDLVAWLMTVNPKGQPQASLIWFVANDDVIVIYSRDDTPRLTNLRANSPVSFQLNSDRVGAGPIVIEGRAEIIGRSPRFGEDAPYFEKYHDQMQQWGFTVEGYTADYPERIHVHPTRLRAK
jgi:PPOX class probable F420-dependent enzyme